MSNAILSASATGTGSVTLLAPVTNSTQTLTLPDATGTLLSTATPGVPVNGPAFSAYQSSTQTLTTGVTTKIQFQTKEFDTNNCFDAVTNYRFTPTVAGYYQVTGEVQMGAAASTITPVIYKNGSSFKFGGAQSTNISYGAGVTALIYFNGATDYVELYVTLGVGQSLGAALSTTYFQAAMVRSAT